MPSLFVTSKKTEYDTSRAGQPSESRGNMSSEPRIEAEKEPFRFPALTPKRRFRANPPVQEERADLSEESPRPAHRQKLKRSGRVILKWPSQATSVAPGAPVSLKIRSYTP